MAFNPDEYLAKKATSFDPDAYLAKVEQPAQPAAQEAGGGEPGLMDQLNERGRKANEYAKYTMAGAESFPKPLQPLTKTLAGAASLAYRGGQAVGSLGDVAMAGIKALTPKPVEQAVSGAVGKIGSKVAPVVAPAVEAYQKLPENVRYGLETAGETALNLSGGGLSGMSAKTGAKQVLKEVAKGSTKRLPGPIEKAITRVSEELTGVPSETLRAASTKQGRVALEAAAGKEAEIGARLADMVDNVYDYLPKQAEIKQNLQQLPVIDPKPFIKKLEDAAGNPQTAELKKASEQIRGKIGELQSIADKYNGYIPADELYDFRKEIDQVISDEFGKSSGKYVSALKNVRYDIKNSLLEAAKGTNYEPMMKDLAVKMDAIDKMKTMLGQSATTREARAESFVRNINNMGKTKQREWLDNFENVFGGDFLNEAKSAQMARQLGEGGKATLFPTQKTGRALMGVNAALAGAAGALTNPAAALAAIPAAALSSPKLTTRAVIPAIRGTGTLANYAGRIGKKGLVPAVGFGAGAQMTQTNKRK